MRSQSLLFLVCSLGLVACSDGGSTTGVSSAGAAGAGGSAGGSAGAAGSAGTGGSAGSSGDAGAGVIGPIAGAVTRYDYVFDVDSLDADTSVTIDVAPPGGDCVDLESLVLPTGQVTWNDMPAASAEVSMGVFHACGAPVGPGPLKVRAPTTFLKKKYLGLDVGFSRTPDMAGGQFTYLLSWVGGCDTFGPCDDDPGTLAEFHFDIKHAAGVPVLCPGALTDSDAGVHCDIAGTLAPTYSAVGWASDPMWKRTPFMTANGVDWVFYEVPTGKLALSLDPATMTEFFGWITGMLGPFPYGKELRFAGGPTTWLGFEHPANIILYEDLASLSGPYADSMTHVTMHETTHQWAGDRVTIATAADFVWKEATAEYLPYVFEDEHLGAMVADVTREYWDSVSLQSQHYPRPTDDPMPVVSAFYGDVYGPGPMVLYVQLEALIGRPAVVSGIQSFLKDPGARSVDDLRKAMEAASGKDLSAYFDAWVFGQGVPEWPTMKVETTQVGSEVTVTVTQQNASGKVYPCVVEVDVKGASQTVTAAIDFGVMPQSAVASAKVTLAEAVVSTALDPKNRVVAREVGKPATVKPRPVWIF